MEETEKQQMQFFNAMDTTELSDIWKRNDRTAWSDDAFDLIERILRDRGLSLEGQMSTAALADPYQQMGGKKGLPFAKFWRGEEPLVVAYWLYGIGPNLALKLCMLAAKADAPIRIVAIVIWATYFPIVCVGIWRSAGRYTGFWLWSALARFSVFLGGLSLVGVVLNLLISD